MKSACWAAILLLFPALVSISSLAADWPAVAPEELKMTSEPLALSAAAVYLFREVDRDDSKANEYNYVRIKILKEEGRRYADVELLYFKPVSSIHDIQARTTRPDGTIRNFDGKVFDKTVVKAKGVRFLAKTFTLPDVEVGSIIEYSYSYHWNRELVYDSHWILSEELFTKHAVFSLKPSTSIPVHWTPRHLPPGTTEPAFDAKRVVRMDVQNIPVFETEDYMPPEDQLKARVDFVYGGLVWAPRLYWENVSSDLYSYIERFLGKPGTLKSALSQIIEPADSPEAKLQKIYARVQRIRNFSFEEEKTEQEQKREEWKKVRNVEDVWTRGYGNGATINWLYLAFLRAAGFEAYPVFVSRRNQYFFDPQLPDDSQLNDTVVLVRLNGKDLYLDPGTAFAPFGLLPWPETGVTGLKLDKNGGSWVTTALPESAISRVERRAALRLSDDGSLEGKLTVSFTGLEALWRRIEERNEDVRDRKKFLEDEVKESVPGAVEVELMNTPDWNSASLALSAEFRLKMPSWMSAAGRHQVLPLNFFSKAEKHVFERETRVHPIYFSFPAENMDDITIQLPRRWRVTGLPAAQDRDAKACVYSLKVENKDDAVHVVRNLDMKLYLTDAKYYPALRNFFQAVRTGDDQQIVLQPGATDASN
jgi:hypothetical protein